MFFLSGLPRSGSTLLGALLSQRPDTYVSATSGLIDTMGAAAAAWESSPMVQKGDQLLADLYPVLGAMAKAKYADRAETVIIDKSRGWPDPKIMGTMAKALGEQPKIIATVRPVAECLSSFIKISKYEGSVKDFVKYSQLAAHLFSSYYTLKAGYESSPANIHFVLYSDLVADPQRECDKVADFLGIERFQHSLTGLSNPVPERDAEVWGIPDLHTVRPAVARTSPDARATLGDRLFEFYQGGEFWPGGSPEPVAGPQLLDLQLEAALHGRLDEAEAFCALADPSDDRAAFNAGWYALRRGRLQEGMALIDRGRECGLVGSPPPSSQPIWDGRRLRGETVLLNLEGGLGDQICWTRIARDIVARGGHCVAAGDPGLAPLLSRAEGVSAFVESRVAGGVYHQFWVPGMSGVRALGLEFAGVDGTPFLPCPSTRRPSGGRLRVGLRWAGNPAFEHEQHRRFDPTPLFDLPDVDLVSLQRDDDTRATVPPHVRQPSLATWEGTASVIAGLDLVISSCTSVAHLAAAMGKPVWLIVPVLPYYLWALPGDTTPWYNSVRLFRQESFGDWTAPLNAIREALTIEVEK